MTTYNIHLKTNETKRIVRVVASNKQQAISRAMVRYPYGTKVIKVC